MDIWLPQWINCYLSWKMIVQMLLWMQRNARKYMEKPWKAWKSWLLVLLPQAVGNIDPWERIDLDRWALTMMALWPCLLSKLTYWPWPLSMVTFCTLTSGQGDALTSTAERDDVLTLTAEHDDVSTLIPELSHVLTLTAQQHGNQQKRKDFHGNLRKCKETKKSLKCMESHVLVPFLWGAAVQWKLANALPVSFPNLLGPRLRGGPRRPRANNMRWNSIPAFPPGRIGGRGSNPLNSYWKFNTLFVKHCISLRLRCDTGRAGPFGPFGPCFSETLAN